MTKQPLVALFNERDYVANLEQALFHEGILVEGFTDAHTALPDLISKQYDLILMGWGVAPGEDYSSIDTDEHIAKLMQAGLPHYERIALHIVTGVIKQIRGYGSANRETPILIHSLAEPQDPIYSDPEKAVLEAGATKYIKGHKTTEELIQEIISTLSR